MRIRNSIKWWWLMFSLGLCLISQVLITGCGKDEIKLSIRIAPEAPKPGEDATVMATVERISSSLSDFDFNWTADKGRITPIGDPSSEAKLVCKYIAPDTPGKQDIITLRVLKGGKMVFMEQKPVTMQGGMVQVSSDTPDQSSQILSQVEAQTGEIFDVDDPTAFVPSGFMGDGKDGDYISVIPAFKDSRPGSPGRACWKWDYKPGGDKLWAAVAWQYPENNWGQKSGLNLTGYSRISFWVKGDKAGEQLVFKAGGHTEPMSEYPASFEASTRMITLTAGWRRHEIDLNGKDLSNVICAFAWVARLMENPDGCIFYIDDIWYER